MDKSFNRDRNRTEFTEPACFTFKESNEGFSVETAQNIIVKGAACDSFAERCGGPHGGRV